MNWFQHASLTVGFSEFRFTGTNADAQISFLLDALWFDDGDFDYACLATGSTGTVVNSSIGTFTGVAGRAFNFPAAQAIHTWGYPAAPPFPGFHIITATSTEWYEVDQGLSGGQLLKYIGNDMTGGSSGGPWWLSTRHHSAEYADTDASDATDPGALTGPFLNGVNSHKRCTVTCYAPPAMNNGVFWREMGPPPFLSDGADPSDSEDIFQTCFGS
ncbi:MAG: hypothetical protein VYE73_02940 [Acidobacteriota bacterium]|nr:hypothetical protein [Acidobacteriota bacterium]